MIKVDHDTGAWLIENGITNPRDFLTRHGWRVSDGWWLPPDGQHYQFKCHTFKQALQAEVSRRTEPTFTTLHDLEPLEYVEPQHDHPRVCPRCRTAGHVPKIGGDSEPVI